MKIADLKEDTEKNVKKLIYKQVLNANKINENCTLLREVIKRSEAQCNDIKLKNYQIQEDILYKNNQL